MVRKVNGQPLVLRYSYTPGGRLSSMTYPDGTLVDYVRNTLGQIAEVGVTSPAGNRQVLVTGADYLPFGPSTGWQYGNGRSLSRTFDLDYRPTGIADNRQDLALSFGYDPVGNLTVLNVGGEQHLIDYDALGRLTAFRDAVTGTAIETYGYDATGNRLLFANASREDAYMYPSDSHRLTAVAGIARTYDAAGNTTSVGGTSKEFVYDDRGRLAQVKTGGAVAQQYAYNGKGERVRRWLGSNATLTAYDEAGQWLGDYDASGLAKQQAIWMDDKPIGLLADGQLYYIEPDHLGSPRLVVDPSRDVAVWRWDLNGEAFGNTAPNEDPDGDGTPLVLDMRFPGQRFDAASGLNYNYFRDYDSSAGRYVQSDPIGLAGGMSTYSYAQSSAFQYADPTGLIAVPVPAPAPGISPPHPLVWAATGGLAAGAVINAGYEHYSGNSIGSDLYDLMNPPESSESGAADSVASKVQQATERKNYSRICKSPIPPTGDKCKDARANIDRLKECLRLRIDFSAKWHGDGDIGHMIQIENTKRAIRKLEEFMMLNCSDQCGVS